MTYVNAETIPQVTPRTHSPDAAAATLVSRLGVDEATKLAAREVRAARRARSRARYAFWVMAVSEIERRRAEAGDNLIYT